LPYLLEEEGREVTSSPFLRAVAISSGKRGKGSDIITFPESSCHIFWKKREGK
jgi:hypothetical protein